MPPSLFRRIHSHVFHLVIVIFEFLFAVLVTVIETVHFYAEDCYDGEVILACASL
jgi:hypothetical protein